MKKIIFALLLLASVAGVNAQALGMYEFTLQSGAKRFINLADVRSVYAVGTGANLILGPEIQFIQVQDSVGAIYSRARERFVRYTETYTTFGGSQNRDALLNPQFIKQVDSLASNRLTVVLSSPQIKFSGSTYSSFAGQLRRRNISIAGAPGSTASDQLSYNSTLSAYQFVPANRFSLNTWSTANDTVTTANEHLHIYTGSIDASLHLNFTPDTTKFGTGFTTTREVINFGTDTLTLRNNQPWQFLTSSGVSAETVVIPPSQHFILIWSYSSTPANRRWWAIRRQ